MQFFSIIFMAWNRRKIHWKFIFLFFSFFVVVVSSVRNDCENNFFLLLYSAFRDIKYNLGMWIYILLIEKLFSFFLILFIFKAMRTSSLKGLFTFVIFIKLAQSLQIVRNEISIFIAKWKTKLNFMIWLNLFLKRWDEKIVQLNLTAPIYSMKCSPKIHKNLCHNENKINLKKKGHRKWHGA